MQEKQNRGGAEPYNVTFIEPPVAAHVAWRHKQGGTIKRQLPQAERPRKQSYSHVDHSSQSPPAPDYVASLSDLWLALFMTFCSMVAVAGLIPLAAEIYLSMIGDGNPNVSACISMVVAGLGAVGMALYGLTNAVIEMRMRRG
jgi:hypothetical protein